MWLLAISIFFTSCLFLTFRAFGKASVKGRSAITINYLWCGLISMLISGQNVMDFVMHNPGAWFAALTGVGFLLVFNLMEIVTVRFGVSTGTIVSRMSMVIPAIVLLVWAGENFTVLGWAGIAVCLSAIALCLEKNKNTEGEEDAKAPNHKPKSIWLFPIMAFIGVGVTDSMLLFAKEYYLTSSNTLMYMGVIMFCAGLTGVISQAFSKKVGLTQANFRKKEWVGGISLGSINIFSLYFFFSALNSGEIEASKVAPINSVGIVVLSTLLSWLIFKDKQGWKKLIAIVLAIGGIVLLSI